MNDRRAPWLWAAVLVPAWIAMVLCTHWEPVIGDGWGHVEFHTEMPLSFASIWEFAKFNYTSMNPRLGQTLTMLLYTPGPWHAIVTPLVELGLFWLLTTLALGRWPSFRKSDDALLYATIMALVAVCAPLFGQMLFYRPFTGNYVFGLAICCAFLVPYRLERAWPWWTALPMFVLGAAAGMANEHTGPAFALAALAATVRTRRAWQIAGVAGIVAGGLALYFAPGQDVRYSELAAQASLLGRIVARGAGNLRPFGQLAGYMSFALPWLALAVVARRSSRREPTARSAGVEPSRPEPMPRERVIATVALAAMAVVIVATLLASPKLGLRLLFASIALACTAVASVVVPQLASRTARAVAWGMAGAALIYTLGRCVLVYHQVGIEYAARIEAITHAAPHARVTVPVYSVHKSRYFYGDDFLIGYRLESVASQFGLDAVELSGQRAATPVPDEP